MNKTILVPAVLLFFATYAAAQKIDSALSVFRRKCPTEKVYIHYNKEYYTAGETIWFKAYITTNHAPSGLSNNFYLLLCDENGTVISNNKYPVKGATVSGSIDIPDSISGGFYSVKAFTAAMLCPDAEFIYKKKFHINNSSLQQTGTAIHDQVPPKISLRFFPEGGSLVGDINSVIAFKAVNEFGYPVEVKGFIKTEDGTMILPFSSYHDGIGQFRFKPQANKKYIAVTEINGQACIFSLPPVQSSGLELKVEQEKDTRVFVISRNKIQKLNFDVFKIVAQINNIVVYENEFYFGDHFSVRGRISTDSLPSGILQITVFNNDDAPILERLSFINNREYEAGATLSVLNLGTKAREMNSLEFDFPDSAQRSCSVAVTDDQNETVVNKENIISSVLLTSDLKGNIFNPGYYFSGQSDSVKNALDNLMLTHGWRRFNWKKILQNEYPQQKIEDEFLINISGTVKNEKKSEIMAGGILNIFICAEDSSLQTYNFPVNEKGQFFLDSLLFTGSARVYYSYTDTKGKQKPVTVFLDEKKPPEWPADVVNADKIPDLLIVPGLTVNKETSDKRYVTLIQKRFENAKELENVNVVSKPKRPVDILNEKYATGIFKTGSRYIIDNVTKPTIHNGAGPGTVVSYILYRFPRIGYQYNGFINMNHFSAMHQEIVYWRVGLFIDEFPATIAELDHLRIEQIAMVKFFDAGFIGVNSIYGGGAIAIYTKKFENIDTKAPEGTYFTYNGYSIEKEFYSPDYSISPDKNKDRDQRTTLCWNPKLYTNAGENSIRVNFYNNDVSRKFKIVLEGFDNKGRLIFLEKIISEGQHQ